MLCLSTNTSSLLSHIEASELLAVGVFSPPIRPPFGSPLAVVVTVTRGVEVRLEVHARVRHAHLAFITTRWSTSYISVWWKEGAFYWRLGTDDLEEQRGSSRSKNTPGGSEGRRTRGGLKSWRCKQTLGYGSRCAYESAQS